MFRLAGLIYLMFIMGFHAQAAVKWNNPSTITGTEYKNTIPPHRINCGTPANDSIGYFPEGIKFKLKNKDIGKCSTDPFPFKSFKPYSERTEVVFDYKFKRNKTHKIRFDLKVTKGYRPPNKSETWFQIKCGPTSEVPVMAFYEAGRYPFKFALAAGTSNSKYVTGINPIPKPKPIWYPVEIVFKNYSESELSVLIDGLPVLHKQKFKRIEDCKLDETLRIGIYRNGNEFVPNKTSEIMYRNISFETFE